MVPNEESSLLPGRRKYLERKLGITNLARLVTFASSVSEGWDIAIFGVVVVPVARDFNLSAWEVGLLASLPLLCGTLSCTFVGVAMDTFGRKPVIIVSYLISGIGCVVMSLATAIGVFALGRCVLAVGLKVGISAVSVYMTELSPAEQRGVLVSLEELYINIGIFSATIAAWVLMDKGVIGWRIYMAAGAVAPMLSLIFIMTLGIPESPRYLQQIGRKDEALDILRSALAGDAREANQVIEAWLEEEKSRKMAGKRSCAEHADEVRHLYAEKSFLIASACWLARACSGISMIATFFTLFVGRHMSLSRALGWFSVATVLKAIALIPSCFYLIEVSGRRVLFLTSAAACALCVMAASIAELHGGQGTLLAALLVLYFMAFSFGYGPVVWVYCFEILPNKIRGKAGTLSMIPADVLSVALIACGPILHEMQSWLPFAVLAVTNTLALVFFWAVCPETKGLVLEHVSPTISSRQPV